MEAHFLHVDLRKGENELIGLGQSVDIALMYQILHLFSWEDQVRIAKLVLSMSKGRSVMVVGSQMGRLSAIEKEGKWGRMFYHTPKTFTKMWEEAGASLETRLEVKCDLVDLGEWGLQEEDYSWMDSEFRALDFVVVREIAKPIE